MLNKAKIEVAVEEFASSLRDLTVNSKPHINFLTKLAKGNSHHAKAIACLINDHLKKVPSVMKLPILYLIDSIIKNVGRDYVFTLSRTLSRSFASIFKEVDSKTRQQMYNLYQTWSDCVCREDLNSIDFQIRDFDSTWKSSQNCFNTKPVSLKILVNPKFLQSRLYPKSERKAAEKSPHNLEQSNVDLDNLSETALQNCSERTVNHCTQAEDNDDTLSEAALREKLLLQKREREYARLVTHNVNEANVKEDTSTGAKLPETLHLQNMSQELPAETIDLVNLDDDDGDTEVALREELLRQKRDRELIKHHQVNKSLSDIESTFSLVSDQITVASDNVPGERKLTKDSLNLYVKTQIQADSTTMGESPSLLLQEDIPFANLYPLIPPPDLQEIFSQEKQNSCTPIKFLAHRITDENVSVERQSRDKMNLDDDRTKCVIQKNHFWRNREPHDRQKSSARRSSRMRHVVLQSSGRSERRYCDQKGYLKKHGRACKQEKAERGQLRFPKVKDSEADSSSIRNSDPFSTLSNAVVPSNSPDALKSARVSPLTINSQEECFLDAFETGDNLPRSQDFDIVHSPSGSLKRKSNQSKSDEEPLVKAAHIESQTSPAPASLPHNAEHYSDCILKTSLLPNTTIKSYPLIAKTSWQSHSLSSHKMSVDNSRHYMESPHSFEPSRKIPLLPLPLYPPIQSTRKQTDQGFKPIYSTQNQNTPNATQRPRFRKISKKFRLSRRRSKTIVNLPPAKKLILDQIFLDTSKAITVDGISREIRFYGEIAVIVLNDDDPREISFKPGGAFVIVNNVSVHCEFHKPEKELTVHGKTLRVRLGSPTRELYVNDEGFQCEFNCAPRELQLMTGEILVVQLQAYTYPLVQIGPQRHDLVAGHVILRIDKSHFVRISLDAKPQRFEVDGVPHVLRFMDALKTILVNDHPVKMDFGGPPVAIAVNGRKHFLRLTDLPPGIVPGELKIINMISSTQHFHNECTPTIFTSDQSLPSSSDTCSYSVPLAPSSLCPSSSSNNSPIFQPSDDIHVLFQSLCDSGLLKPPKKPIEYQECPQGESEKKIYPVDLKDSLSLKIKQPGVIDALYCGIQCSSCGVRFHHDQITNYRSHLDWHFYQNHQNKDVAKSSGRMWHHTSLDWIQLREPPDKYVKAKADVRASAECRDSRVEKLPSVPCHDYPNGTVCEVCQEKFEEFFNEDQDEWHIKNCITNQGMSYHPLCFKDLNVLLSNGNQGAVKKSKGHFGKEPLNEVRIPDIKFPEESPLECSTQDNTPSQEVIITESVEEPKKTEDFPVNRLQIVPHSNCTENFLERNTFVNLCTATTIQSLAGSPVTPSGLQCKRTLVAHNLDVVKEINVTSSDDAGRDLNNVPVMLKPKLCGRKLTELPPTTKCSEVSSLCSIV